MQMFPATVPLPQAPTRLPGKDAQIPLAVLRKRGLTHLDRIIYGEIRALGLGPEGCWASDEYLAQVCDCTPRQIRRAYLKLEVAALVYVHQPESKPGRKQPRRKLFPLEPWLEDETWISRPVAEVPEVSAEPEPNRTTRSSRPDHTVQPAGPHGPDQQARIDRNQAQVPDHAVQHESESEKRSREAKQQHARAPAREPSCDSLPAAAAFSRSVPTDDGRRTTDDDGKPAATPLGGLLKNALDRIVSGSEAGPAEQAAVVQTVRTPKDYLAEQGCPARFTESLASFVAEMPLAELRARLTHLRKRPNVKNVWAVLLLSLKEGDPPPDGYIRQQRRACGEECDDEDAGVRANISAYTVVKRAPWVDDKPNGPSDLAKELSAAIKEARRGNEAPLLELRKRMEAN